MQYSGKHSPSGLSRKDIDLPDWVERAMFMRWFAIGIGLVLAVITGLPFFALVGFVVFFGVGYAVYHIYKQEDPVSAEIAFYNEADGFHSGDGDGDGDGGGDGGD
ncbi:hypothetical protein AB1A64_20445 [Ruegeria sp. ANG10]|uniref:hypothetical protein n=1 Tax=Ruegeria sp. ANG10 TaxID=3042467 RepID=UPI0034549A72